MEIKKIYDKYKKMYDDLKTEASVLKKKFEDIDKNDQSVESNKTIRKYGENIIKRELILDFMEDLTS
jgi:hypothetical protein